MEQKNISQLALTDVQYCILDLETTGFDPINDGIVEIGLFKMDGHGNKLDEFNTLINPQQPVRCTEIHGITDEDVIDAPKIIDVYGHIARFLSNSIIVAYNAYFDVSFLEQKFFRPLSISNIHPFLCSMFIRGIIGLKPARTKLVKACKEANIELLTEHHSHFDINAVADLLRHYLKIATQSGYNTFSDLKKAGKKYKFVETWNLPLPNYPWQSLSVFPPKPRTGEMKDVSKLEPSSVTETSFYIDNLLGRVWESVEPYRQKGYEEYLSCLSAALSDRILTQTEVDQLKNIAINYGMTLSDIRKCHEQFYQMLLNAAIEDKIITNEEKADLEKVANLLGISV